MAERPGLAVSWVKPSAETAVATVLHQGADPGSHWRPWLESDGYEFVGQHRIQYQMQTGRYNEFSGDPASTPSAAPDCAASAYMITYSRDRQKRTVFTYTEGRECDRLSTFGNRDAEALRQRAYQAFGLR